MTWAGVNYWAVLLAAIAGFMVGGVWYRLLAEPWMAATGITREQIKAHHGGGGDARHWLPFAYAFAAMLVMALAFAGMLGHFGGGQVNVRNGIISAVVVWLGFVLPVMLVNNSFALRDPRLLAIDGGYWLVVLVLMGAIIGRDGRLESVPLLAQLLEHPPLEIVGGARGDALAEQDSTPASWQAFSAGTFGPWVHDRKPLTRGSPRL